MLVGQLGDEAQDESGLPVLEARQRLCLQQVCEGAQRILGGKARHRRLALLEEAGLECALWPCLFWRLDQTFSNERATDPRRQQSETLEEALRPPARLEEEEEAERGVAAESDGEDVRHSIKRLYNSLALGCLLGYTEHFEILQYVSFISGRILAPNVA